ncbi:MAG: NUDIX hydrolase [Lachnospiraceae bacterium]|nr:NUDIX hydrolase [Lachnospiraceae bacterium]
MEEKEFLENYNPADFERLSVAVDLLVFTMEENKLKIVLVEREEHPFQNKLSLPGVFVGMEETLDQAAIRGITEETGLKYIYFEQLYTWGEIKRDPRMRVISVSYIAIVDVGQIQLSAGARTASVALYDVDELLDSDVEIAFDHKKMIAYGRERIRNKIEYSNIAFEFLPEEFTLPELQRVYEVLLHKKLHKTSFRQKVEPLVEQTGQMKTGDAYRPSKYYRLKKGET